MPRLPKKTQEITAEALLNPNEDSPITGRPMISFETFEQVVSGIGPNEAPAIYFYRTSPRINRKLTGKALNIGRLNHPFPKSLMDYAKVTFGGGDYKLQLNAENRSTNQVCETTITIPMAEHEPILDPAELVMSDDVTKQLVQRWVNEGKVVVENGMIYPAGSRPQQASGTEEYAQKKLIDIATAKLEGNGQQALTIADVLAIVAAMNGGNKGDSAQMTMVMEALREAREENRQMRQEFREALKEKTTRTPTTSRISEVRELLEFTKELQGMNGGGADRPFWQGLLDKLADNLPQAAAAFGLLRGGPAPGPIPFNQPPPRPTAPATTAAAPTPTAAAAAPQPSAPKSEAERQMEFVFDKAIEAIRKGIHGATFADSISLMFSDQYLKQLKSVGKAVILSALTERPDVQSQLEGYDYELFIDQFLSDEEYDDTPDAEPSTTKGATTA